MVQTNSNGTTSSHSPIEAWVSYSETGTPRSELLEHNLLCALHDPRSDPIRITGTLCLFSGIEVLAVDITEKRLQLVRVAGEFCCARSFIV